MGKKNEAGKYRGRVQIGLDKDGKPINKYVCAPTMRELEDRKTEIRRHYIEGVPIKEDMLFYEFAEQWYTVRKEPFITAGTRSSYVTMFQKHILPAFGMRHLRAISANQLQEFINSFKGTSKSQITMAVGLLKAIMSSAYADGIIPRDPSVSLIRPKAAAKKTERRALTDSETTRVLQTIRRHPDGLILAVLYYLGLRRGEALGLKWDDFDFSVPNVHVQRDIDFVGSTAQEGELKTAASNRFVPLPNELIDMLLKVRGFPGQYVFTAGDNKPLSESTFKRKWLSLMEDCGCVEMREVPESTRRKSDIRKRLKPTLTPHYFRHNFVTMLFNAGVDPLIAMKIVGHTDYQTTANIYTHLNDESIRRAGYDMSSVFATRAIESSVKATAKVAAKALRDPRSRKPEVDSTIPWAHSFGK